MFKIEKAVPIPRGNAKYPFKEMQVGDSFFVPKDRVKNAQIAAYAWAKRNGVVLASRSVDGGLRIWRTA